MASSNKEINPLHSAATVTTLFTLSGVRESELRDHSFLKNAPHDIIARSGGIGNARITRRRHHLRAQEVPAEDKIVRTHTQTSQDVTRTASAS
jgi:hypothetical protein